MMGVPAAKISMDIKDYSETVSVRLTKAQVQLLKAHADALGISQSDLIREWLSNADLIPIIPAELKAAIRQKTDAATRHKQIVNVLNLHFNSWLT